MPTPQENRFIERVINYPVVNDTYIKVTDYYSWAKNKNSMVNSSLNWTESVLHAGALKVQPVVNRFDGQIASIDRFSCRQLDRIEEKYPIVLEPTEQVIEKTKEFCNSTVKQSVNGIIQPVMRPIVKTYSGVSNGISSVSQKSASAVIYLSATRGGKMVMSRMNDALDLADRSVDRYLPEIETDHTKDSSENMKSATIEKSEGINPIARTSALTNKIRRRMYTRAMQDLKNLRLRSEESIKKMTHSVDLIAYARTHIDNAKTTGLEFDAEWRKAMMELEEDEAEREEEMRKENEMKEIDELSSDMSNKRNASLDHLMNSARFWAHRLRIATTAATLVTYRHLPENLREKLNVAKSYSNNLYNVLQKSPQIEDLKESFVETARHALQLISDNMETTLEYLKESRIGSWLYPKELSECIEMHSLSPVYLDRESKPDTSKSDRNTDFIQHELIQPSPTSMTCRDSTGNVDGKFSDVDTVNNMPLVSDDELE